MKTTNYDLADNYCISWANVLIGRYIKTLEEKFQMRRVKDPFVIVGKFAINNANYDFVDNYLIFEEKSDSMCITLTINTGTTTVVKMTNS